MSITRRSTLKILAGAPALGLARAQAGDEIPTIAPGPFKGTREGLQAYRVPDWYREAKFGIWAHWGPQSAPEYGDWYARNMYIQGSRQYEYHVKRYGHPSKSGFKDVIRTWKAEKFDPAGLMDLYVKAGAKYFVSMGVHHDNFDLWNSRHQPRWNAMAAGPKKDIVGMWRDEARRRGLRFGVSEHLYPSYNWFAVSHGSDKTGPHAGVPYDGNDPQYADLYHEPHGIPPGDKLWDPTNVPVSWRRHWMARIRDLVDQYEPDLLYTDGGIPYEEWGLSLVAHHYNASAKRHGGITQAVYTSKNRKDCASGTCVLDLERGVVEGIWPNYWQTDTCVGDWHYNTEAKYKSPKLVVDMLVDIVSRNGNLLLNFPVRSDGTLDEQEHKILREVAAWMAVNSEAIHATTPWKTFGEGPGTQSMAGDGHFNEAKRKLLSAADVRFSTKRNVLYAFTMDWPEKEAVFAPLAPGGKYGAGKIRNVELLGHKGKLQWTQDAAGLRVTVPAQKPCEYAAAFRITGA